MALHRVTRYKMAQHPVLYTCKFTFAAPSNLTLLKKTVFQSTKIFRQFLVLFQILRLDFIDNYLRQSLMTFECPTGNVR
jgi:hypothetical protein